MLDHSSDGGVDEHVHILDVVACLKKSFRQCAGWYCWWWWWWWWWWCSSLESSNPHSKNSSIYLNHTIKHARTWKHLQVSLSISSPRRHWIWQFALKALFQDGKSNACAAKRRPKGSTRGWCLRRLWRLFLWYFLFLFFPLFFENVSSFFVDPTSDVKIDISSHF